MYRLEREEFVRAPFIFLWGTLGFQAGFINAFGFLAVGRFVSHVTGVGTQVGLALGQGVPLLALELLGIPLTFLLGSFTSALFSSARIERQQRPFYGLITILMPAVIAIVMYAGLSGKFGVFGEPLQFTRDFALLFLLSFVCGMQNGCFATMTRGQIRTTHLTGITTDLGTDLARVWFGRLSENERALTSRTNISRFVTFVGFSMGSILSVLATQYLEHAALSVPLIIATFVCLAVRRIHIQMDRRYDSSALPS